MKTLKIDQNRLGIMTVTLARAEKRNAMSGEMISELRQVADTLQTDVKTRVVVLAAEGDVFCAGGDLNWMREQMTADEAQRRREATALAEMLYALNTIPQPLIGRVHGNAFGGGVGLMAVCDAIVALQGTRFGLTETRLGLIPATIGPYVVARMGEAKARRVFFSSRMFDVDEAMNLGLVSSIVTAEQLDAAVMAEVEPYLACAPGAVREAKALARNLGPRIDRQVIEASIDALITRWASDEAAEGTAAFFEKRPPGWANS